MLNAHLNDITNRYFPELTLKGFYLSHKHTLEMAHPDDDICNFGLYPLISTDMTGHNHIALRPLPSKPLDEWPVMQYNELEG